MSGGSLGLFAKKYLTNCFTNVWVSRFFKQMSKPHFSWNPCRSQNVPNKRCKPWVLCVRNLCSQIIKWYLIDTQWPLFVYIVSKDRTLPQPFFDEWLENHDCLIDCCLHFFRNNVSNPECSSFPQITFSNKFINTCSRIRGLLTLHLLESNLGLAVNLSFNEQYEIHAQRMSASPPSILRRRQKIEIPNLQGLFVWFFPCLVLSWETQWRDEVGTAGVTKDHFAIIPSSSDLPTNLIALEN